MAGAAPDRPVRPANRRELIAEAAGRAFGERGYHAVGMDDIASSVGITAAALYRHFPNKYALFVHCTRRLADGLAEDLATLPEDTGLEDLLAAIARTTVANRASGGIFRWEARYLERPEREAVRDIFRQVVDRFATAVAREREDATLDATLLAGAALGAIGSATAHHTAVGARRMEAALTGAAMRVARAAATDGPGPAAHHAPAHPPRVASPDRREQILRAAVALFHRDGYAEASMGAIAAEVGLTASGLYRHYDRKADILAAACLEAAEVLGTAVDTALVGAAGPEEALPALAAAYVGYSFEHTALTSVATAEIGGLPADLQRPLRTAQREHVALWQRHLQAARPDLDPLDARLLVHAGLGVVTEAGRALRWEDTPGNRRVVAALVLAALGM